MPESSRPAVPDRLVHNGGIYILATAPDERVELNVATTCATREAVRDHATATGATMQEVVNRALRLYLAAHGVSA